MTDLDKKDYLRSWVDRLEAERTELIRCIVASAKAGEVSRLDATILLLGFMSASEARKTMQSVPV